FQNTGVSWNNVNLTLATTNPSIGATKPELNPWYLRFYTPAPRNRTLSEVSVTSISSKRGKVSAAPPVAPDYNEAMEDAGAVSDFTQVTESTLSVNFKIGIPYSIPSDGKRQLVDIQQLDVPATYKYSAVPKLSADAFLLAQITGWD